MQPLQSARGFRTFLHDTQSLSNRRSRLGLFTLEDRQAAGSLMDVLLAGAMASDQARPIPSLTDNPRFGVFVASPLPVIADANNAVALLGRTHDEAASDQSVAPNPLGTFAGEGGGQFIGFGDLDAVSNAAPISIGDFRVAPSAFQSPSGPVDGSAAPPFVRPTAQNAPPSTATSMESNTPFAAQAAAYLAAIGTNSTPSKFENPTVSFGPMYSYSGGGKVILITKAVVMEVEYLGDVIRIAADPGTPAYPMTGPQYRDNNANGIIEPEQGDLQLPVAYPRGSYVVVTAKFMVETTLMEGSPGTGEVKIEGTSPNSGIHILPTTASWSGDYVTLPPTSSMNTLANVVQYYPSSGYPYSQSGFGISWSLSHNQAGQSGFIPAGASFNEMYVTLAAPTVGPVYHSIINLSVPISAEVAAVDEPTVIAQTWKNFQTKQVTNRHINAKYNGMPLTYYKQWDTKVSSWEDLIKPPYDGRCGAFEEAFVEAIRQAGAVATPISHIQIGAVDKNEYFLVNNWTLPDQAADGKSGNNAYPYLNTLANPAINPDMDPFNSYMRKNVVTNVWEYYWGDTVQVSDDPGAKGQNTTNPASLFFNHWVVKISGKYYDPSYGSGTFTGIPLWEQSSIAALAIVEKDANNKYRFVLRDPSVEFDDFIEWQSIPG